MKKSSSRHVIGVIPARYASTRFPGKPLADIKGKTLIQRTYENAKLCKALDLVVVATDDKRIFEHVKSFGGDVVMTSEECPTGTDRIAEVIRGTRAYDKAQIIINIQGDEPCLDPDVITKVVEILENDPQAVMSTAIVPLLPEEAGNSSVVKCVIDKLHNALYFSRALIPAGLSLSMQPKVHYYKHMGIYGYRRDFLLHYAQLTSTPLMLAESLEQLKVLEHGYRIKAAVVTGESIGVDLPEDIKKVEQLLCKQNTSS